MSTTVIDSLLIELGFKGKDAIDGLKNTEDSLARVKAGAASTAQEMEHRGDQAALFFKKIRSEALLLLSVFTAGVGIEHFVKNTVNEMAALGLTAENLNMPTTALTQWQLAAEKAGSSAGGITQAIAKANADIANIHAGNGEVMGHMSEGAINYFSRGGSDPTKFKNGIELILEQSRILRDQFAKNPAEAGILAQSMGISEENFNMLKRGPEAVLALVKAQEKFAITMARDAEEAFILKNKTIDLRHELDSVSNKITLALFPAFEKILGILRKFGDYILEHREQISKTVASWADVIMSFADKANGAAKAVGGWQNVLGALLAMKLGSLAADLFLMAGGLLRISGGLGAIAALGGGALKVFAGAAGYVAGTAIYNAMPVSAQDAVGSGVAHIAGFFGSDEANSAIATNKRYNGKQKIAALAPEIMRYFMAHGWTKEQSAGITAQLWAESAFDYKNRTGDHGTAHGIAQWRLERRIKFEELFNKQVTQGTLEEQLAFVNWELNNSHKKQGDMIRATHTAKEAGIAGVAYEAPLDTAGAQRTRGGIAEMMAALPIAQGNAKPAAGATVTSTTQIDQININTQATDAIGIAKSIKDEISSNALFQQIDTGMN